MSELSSVAILVFALAGSCQNFARADQPAPASNRTETERYDAGDYYLFDGRRVTLRRSLDRIVVSFRPGTPGARQRHLVENEVPGALLIPEKGSQERDFSIVRLPFGSSVELDEKKRRLEAALTRIKGRPEVDYAYPVLVNPETGTRLYPSDEIVVRLRPETELEALTRRFRLRVAGQVRGTPDQYRLRLVDAKAANPLDAANQLVEAGVVAWAEPDFTQEYERQ